jgi:hypothetical protein
MTRGPKPQDSRLIFLSGNISRAKNRRDGKKITLTPQQAFEIGQNQKWRCAITKKKLEFTRGGTHFGGKWCNPLSCSIDRIDNSKGYTKDNVQLVTWACNRARGNLSVEDFKFYLGLK